MSTVPTREQMEIATPIHTRMEGLMGADVLGDMALYEEMRGHLPAFITIMDNASQAEMDELCRRYRGFQRYTSLLTRMALRIANGSIEVP